MLDARRRAQRTVQSCLVEVAERLVPGDRERDAARMLREALVARGATGWFHEPYVWFGDHTAPTTRRRAADFDPTDRRCTRGMAIILDVAPIIDGMIVDTSYTFACAGARSAELDHLLRDLSEVRASILAHARTASGPLEIYRAVEQLAAARGFRTCHGLTPLGPLAHRVDRVRTVKVGARVAGVDAGVLLALGARELVARVIPNMESPLWTGHPRGGRRPLVGLWSVEPHLARGDIGAKLEEVLVVTENGAEWLDDAPWLP